MRKKIDNRRMKERTRREDGSRGSSDQVTLSQPVAAGCWTWRLASQYRDYYNMLSGQDHIEKITQSAVILSNETLCQESDGESCKRKEESTAFRELSVSVMADAEYLSLLFGKTFLPQSL